MVKNHWVGKISGEGSGNLLQYSCPENSIDRGSWWVIFSGITKESDTTDRLSSRSLSLSLSHTHTHTHTHSEINYLITYFVPLFCPYQLQHFCPHCHTWLWEQSPYSQREVSTLKVERKKSAQNTCSDPTGWSGLFPEEQASGPAARKPSSTCRAILPRLSALTRWQSLLLECGSNCRSWSKC